MANSYSTVSVKVVNDELKVAHAGREVTVSESLRKQLSTAERREIAFRKDRKIFLVKGEDDVVRGFILDAAAIALLGGK